MNDGLGEAELGTHSHWSSTYCISRGSLGLSGKAARSFEAKILIAVSELAPGVLIEAGMRSMNSPATMWLPSTQSRSHAEPDLRLVSEGHLPGLRAPKGAAAIELTR